MVKNEDTAAEEGTENKVDSRIKILPNVPVALEHPLESTDVEKLKEIKGKTEPRPRAEFIREMWATRLYNRSQITNMCRAWGDDPDMKYQIVFQATKGHEGGPEPVAPEASGDSE